MHYVVREICSPGRSFPSRHRDRRSFLALPLSLPLSPPTAPDCTSSDSIPDSMRATFVRCTCRSLSRVGSINSNKFFIAFFFYLLYSIPICERNNEQSIFIPRNINKCSKQLSDYFFKLNTLSYARGLINISKVSS